MGKKLEEKCHDCSVEIGEVHKYGCDWEECPFCGDQLLGCGCIYDKLKLIDYEKNGFDFDGLAQEIYDNGPTTEQEERFVQILNEKGRIPYGSEKRVITK